MARTLKIRGLQALGMSLRDLRKDLDRVCEVSIGLRTYDLTPSVLRLAPKDRHAYLEVRANKWLRDLVQVLGTSAVRFHPSKVLPSFATGKLMAKTVLDLVKLRGIQSIHISGIQGGRRVTTRRSRPWYCVRGLVAIQVEGQTHGMQTVEDRFLIVQASSFKDAERRLKREWRHYSHPYMNPSGFLVRWTLEKIEDVYLIGDETIGHGTEVYSRLRTRRLPRKRASRSQSSKRQARK